MNASTRSRPARALIFAALLVGVLNLGFYVLNLFYGSPGGAPSSAFGTVPEGAAAYAQLLQATGYRVDALRTPLAQARIDPPGTLLVLEPESMDGPDVEALRRFVERGGRLVTGGRDSDRWLDQLLEDPPEWSANAIGDISLAPSEELGDVENIVTVGRGEWSDTGEADRLSATGIERLLLVVELDEGRVWLLSDVSPLQNRALGEADNAVLGLALAGEPSSPVYFAESIHGYNDATGLGAIPWRARWSLGLLGIAALVWLYARSRRLGPPQLQGMPLGPQRAAYVHALATTLARTRHPSEATEPVLAAARREVERRAGLTERSDLDALRRASGEFGLDDEEVRAIVDGDTSDPLIVGRALAHLNRGRTMGGHDGE